jgi:ribosomal protein S18 acetylase RimI-like enzyme
MDKAVVAVSAISLRPVEPEDELFLLEVYATTRADELALVPWDEEQKQAFVRMQFDAQQYHYRKFYPEGKHEIILCGDRPVGRLYVAEMDQEIRILDITVLPPDRNVGIGSHLIEELLDQAARARKSLSVHVESFNPSLHLFERLGFAQTETQGIYVLMKWIPGDSVD